MTSSNVTAQNITPIRQDTGTTAAPIPAMKNGWFFRKSDGAVLYERKTTEQGPDGKPVTFTELETVGYVPEVTGMVTRRAEDGRHTSIEYRLKSKDGSRVVSEDDLDYGSWAGKLGVPKPSGRDAIQAFATMIRAGGLAAPEVPGIPFKDKDGDLHLPDASSQEAGYRVLAGDEDQAMAAWRRITVRARSHPRTMLVLGAIFIGPLIESLDVPAHILNVTGEKQTGKSTTQAVQAAMLGATRGYYIFQSWNSSPQGIPQALKNARFMPMVREEHSTIGMSLAASESLLSQIVGGADRATGGKDGSIRPSVGRWHSILSSSSNAPLRRTGQTEDLGSRLYEVSSPFWGSWQVADEVEELAHAHHGWPLEWAVREGMFTADNIRRWKDQHREVTARLHPEGGGFARTIAKTHAAWVVGAAMLEQLLDVTGLAEAAEAAAVELLPDAVVSAGAATIPAGQLLWDALDGVRGLPSDFPDAVELPGAMEDPHRHRNVRGYVRTGEQELWVLPSALAEIAKNDGIENLSACIDDLKRRGVLIPGDGRNDRCRLAPRTLRDVDGLPGRMYRFSIEKAKTAYEEKPEEEAVQKETPAPAPLFCRGCGLEMMKDLYGDGLHATCTAPVAKLPAPRSKRTSDSSIATRVTKALEDADGDREKAKEALIKSAIPDAMELLEATRASARYDFTAHPPEPDILKQPGKGRANLVWEARPNWTNQAIPEGTEVHALDVNAAYLSAMNTHLPIGKLEHSDSGEFDRHRSGLYLVTPPAWTRSDLPNPLGNREEPGPVWLARPTVQALMDAHKNGMSDAMKIHESWTSGSSENLLRAFRDQIRDARMKAIEDDDDLTLAYVKPMYSKFISTATKASRFNHLLERTDWAQIIRSQAHANLWRRAVKAHAAGLAVYSVKGTDELHVAGDWRKAFPEGRGLRDMKTKGAYLVGGQMTTGA